MVGAQKSTEVYAMLCDARFPPSHSTSVRSGSTKLMAMGTYLPAEIMNYSLIIRFSIIIIGANYLSSTPDLLTQQSIDECAINGTEASA
jgi:hypothetical protein